MRGSIRYQLFLSYLLISIFTASVTYALAFFTSEQRKNTLALEYQTEEIKQEVRDWYRTEATWHGFAHYFSQLHPPMFFERNGEQISEHYRENKRPKHHGIVALDNTMLTPYLSYRIGEEVSQALMVDAQPIYLEDVQIAWLILPETTGLSLSSQLKIFLDNLHQILLIAVICGVCASIVIGYVLSRWMLKPLLRLLDAMSLMASGRLQQSVPVTSSNELGELTKGFNLMSDSIAKADLKRRQLTADITHDLSTPVQVISGYVEMAQQGALPLDEKRLEIVSAELMLIQRLIKDMNLLSKTDDSSLALQVSSVPINVLLERVYQRFLPKCEQKGIRLNLELNQALGDAFLDEERMIQVLGNLMDNAIRHTPGHGRITLSAYNINVGVEIAVTDTGDGIAAEQLPYIFDRFYRAEGARTSIEGNSGLGLSICKGLVEMQGLTIRAVSDGCSGSQLIINIPANLIGQ